MQETTFMEILNYKLEGTIPGHIKHKTNFKNIAAKYQLNDRQDGLMRNRKTVLRESDLPEIKTTFINSNSSILVFLNRCFSNRYKSKIELEN